MLITEIRPGDWVVTPMGKHAKVIRLREDNRLELAYTAKDMPGVKGAGREVVLAASLLRPWRLG